MKHIIKVNNIQEAKDSDIRPIIAMDTNKHLFFEGKVAGPQIEFVDLGLSVKWGNANLGATNGNTAESWYGDYYAWGETKSKTNYVWNTYTFGASQPFSKYDSDGKTVLETVDDVATQTNSEWRMPTKEDFEELKAGTTKKWETNYKGVSGLNGRLFTSKVNGNSLFIPAAGYRIGSDIQYVSSRCFLWSSSLYFYDPINAYTLFFYSSDINTSHNFRYSGYSVRPVC